jgi:hypothetical protein
LEGLEFEGQERIEFLFIGGMGLRQTGEDGLLEGGKTVVIFGIQALLFDKLPEPFNKVQVGGIRGQKEKFQV